MTKTEFQNYRKKEEEWKKKKEEIALEIVGLLKSNNLSVFQINEIMESVEKTVKCQAHL